jgi:molybdopterin synthase catalytic subunit
MSANHKGIIMNYLIEGAVTPGLISEMIEAMAAMTDCGGHSAFMGQVRADIVDGKTVKAIEYSAYESMVRTEAEQIKAEILAEFEDAKSVEIIHSTGRVMASEISLFVLVSAGHRRHAIEACSKSVELIKERLPVWKKEIFDDDSHAWPENSPYQSGV